MGDLKGVYLNNTPVIDSSGNSNVNGMTAQWVSGTLEQPALEGFLHPQVKLLWGLK